MRLLCGRGRAARPTQPEHGKSLIAQLSVSLAAAPSDSERARRGLMFLTRYGEAVGGILYALEAGTLKRAASFGELPAEATVDAWAQRYFDDQRAAQAATTSEPELRLPDDPLLVAGSERYLPTLLGHEDLHGYRPTGLALLILPEGSDLSWLTPVSIALSRSLFGDARPDGVGSGVRHVDDEEEA
jgi:hypothetical protein